jgi:hypothetical protein
VRLADQRDAQANALVHETGLDAIVERDDELGDIACVAEGAVEIYPVRSVADLIRKLEISEEQGYSEVLLDRPLADLRRIEARA